MKTHYETADSVEDVAIMLGRPRYSVVKKALAMGLKRPDLHEASIARLRSGLDETPRSSDEIARLIGMTRSATNDLLRRGHDAGVCHIADHRPCVGRGKETPLWVAGEGENAQTDYAVEQAEREAKRAEHAAKPFKAFRDPFTSVFFGGAA